MRTVDSLAGFVKRASFEDLSREAAEQLKIRVVDSLGCAIGALDADVILKIRRLFSDFEFSGGCTLIGARKAAPDRAAFYNGALIRYLDFNDSYLAKGETCHPSDNLGAVLAAAEQAGRSGRELLVALAVAYQVQCRLSDEAPVRAKGFDHTVQGAYAAAAGVAKALNLEQGQIANAIAISGTAYNALRVTRTGSLSNWKGLAAPNTASGATFAALLARYGITGPPEVFEGNKGFMQTISGPFHISWEQENLERVRQTILKKYNAEIHSQSSLEGVLELKQRHGFQPDEIARLDVEVFDVAYHIIGGGEEGEKKRVRTKEEADHSLPYMIAAAILDGNVMPEQYTPERIGRNDVQQLLQRIHVRDSERLSQRFPAEMPARISVRLNNGDLLSIEKSDYEGFHTRPMSFETVAKKFETLADPVIERGLRQNILDAVMNLEDIAVRELTGLLGQVASKKELVTR